MTNPTGDEVRAVLDRFLELYRAKDSGGLLGLVTDDTMLVGTGADEVRFGRDGFRAQAERDFSQADEMSMTYDDLRVSVVGDVAFAYASVRVAGSAGGEDFEMSGLRATFALVRGADGWKLAQMHLSVSDSAQDEGSSFES